MSDSQVASAPITVSADPSLALVETLIGQIIPALGGVAVSFGMISTNKATAITGLLSIVASGLWRLWRTTRNQTKLRTLAHAVSDDVGIVK